MDTHQKKHRFSFPLPIQHFTWWAFLKLDHPEVAPVHQDGLLGHRWSSKATGGRPEARWFSTPWAPTITIEPSYGGGGQDP